MKDSQGTSNLCPSLKSLTGRVGGALCCRSSPNIYKKLDAKLEKKMVEMKKSSLGQNNFRSIDSIILKFPQFREGLKEIRSVFEQYDEDSNGTIDLDELKKSLHELQFQFREEEIDDLFHACDMDDSKGIQFNEFIVLLCLIYILLDSATQNQAKSKMGSPELQSTFNTLVEVFLFLDKNGNGKLHKKDVVKTLNEASPWERSPSHVTRTRFKEMDWDGNGHVSFREFLFAFVDWVGIDSDDEDPSAESQSV